MPYKNTVKNQKKRNLKLFIFLAVLICALALLGLELTGKTNFYTRETATSPEQTTKPVNTVNYNPPTTTETSSGNDKKQEIVSKNEDTTTQEKPQSAEVVIVDASQYSDEIEVRAFIANTIEEGTCTLLFSLEGQPSFTKQVPAHPDASTTPCMTITIPRSEFTASGNWQLTLSYESSAIKGSKSQEVSIQ